MRIERFSSLVIEGQIARAPHFKSLALMLSKPIALFVFRESRCLSTVSSSTSFSEKDCNFVADLTGNIAAVDILFARLLPMCAK